MKLAASLALALILPAAAHHGQDFLVAIDAGVNRPWEFRTTFGGEFSDYGSFDENALTQSVILGLPHNLTFINILRYADGGSGSWNTFSTTPMLQWTAPPLGLKGPLSSLRFAVAAGWEIPINRGYDHDHDHGVPPMMDCSSLVAIPPAFLACQLANQNAANHIHGSGGHAHDGIHRHGESHGFLRFVAELNPTPQDRVVFNTITVFPEDGSVNWGYAAAYRHRFGSKFAMGVEAIGDFNTYGEHLVYLTGTSYFNRSLSFTVGAATGLNSKSPDLTLQTLLSWRF
jgi:hypothetical protein